MSGCSATLNGPVVVKKNQVNMMTFDERVEQCMVIQYCADAGMYPLEIVRKMHKTDRFNNVSRALEYKWHG
jgi:hypothetical protein